MPSRHTEHLRVCARWSGVGGSWRWGRAGFREVPQIIVQLQGLLLPPAHPTLPHPASPHPSMAPLPAASPRCLLWQMFGCAMATPEQDVPLDLGRDEPTLRGYPHRSHPQTLVVRNHLGPGWGQMAFVLPVSFSRWISGWGWGGSMHMRAKLLLLQ